MSLSVLITSVLYLDDEHALTIKWTRDLLNVRTVSSMTKNTWHCQVFVLYSDEKCQALGFQSQIKNCSQISLHVFPSLKSQLQRSCGKLLEWPKKETRDPLSSRPPGPRATGPPGCSPLKIRHRGPTICHLLGIFPTHRAGTSFHDCIQLLHYSLDRAGWIRP